VPQRKNTGKSGFVTRRTNVCVTRDTSRACGCRAVARGNVRGLLENDAMAASLAAELCTAHERPRR
jgi:hypothetical protein